MPKKLLLFILLIFFISAFGSVFNSLKIRSNSNSSLPASANISLNLPDSAIINQPAQFQWLIDSPADLTTTSTTIYWDYDSTPSALTTADSPQAVQYHYSIPDYFTGIFNLPDTFSASIIFPKPGTIYLRAYALIGNRHFWSPEAKLIVKQK